ncbi:MAG TPA: ATP-binding cassette domain-containing protein [Candidatus Acidoferrales bacterium]|nr:ATP-binding cassette domain-containing protein [Candidatus Acidoferrales bacterium]
MSDGVLPGAPSRSLLQVRNLNVDLLAVEGAGAGGAARPAKPAPILSEISFEIEPGTIVGLFGESGCGKTTLALALLNLLSPAKYRVRGEVRMGGRNLLGLTDRQLEGVRGAEICLIFQDPLLALNPVLRAGTQVSEVMRAHGCEPAGASLESLFHLAGLADWRRIAAAYPHQLSGGERQRVVIAQALACQPALVIADEPFTALDAVRVVELAALFRNLRSTLRTSFLLISHSPGVMAATADCVLVMHGGRIVERGAPRQVL